MNEREDMKRLFETLFPGHEFSWRDYPGGYAMGLCPWHPENNPSLSVFPAGSTWRYRCHGCGETGTREDLLEELGEPSRPRDRIGPKKHLIPILRKAALTMQEFLLDKGCPFLDTKVPAWREAIGRLSEERIPLVGLYPSSQDELWELLAREGLDPASLKPYLWPEDNGRPWDLKGWLAWFVGRPKEVCRIRARKPSSKNRTVLPAFLPGGLVGLQLFPKDGPVESALLVEGETDLLAVISHWVTRGGGIPPTAATGSAQAVEQAVRETAPLVSDFGVLYCWPDFDPIEGKKGPGLWAGARFLQKAREFGISGAILFPAGYCPGQDPCSYLTGGGAVSLKRDSLNPSDYLTRLVDELASRVAPALKDSVKKTIRTKLNEMFPGIEVAGVTICQGFVPAGATLEETLEEAEEPPREVMGICVNKGAYDIVISAATGAGKTTFVANFLVQAITDGAIDFAAVVIPEMSQSEYELILFNAFRLRACITDRAEAIQAFKREISPRIHLVRTIPLEDLLGKVREIADSGERPFLVLDPVQDLIRSLIFSHKYRDISTAGEYFISRLVDLAHTHGLGLISVSEMHRDTAAEVTKARIRRNISTKFDLDNLKEVLLSKLKGTGALENKAAQAFTLGVWRKNPDTGEEELRCSPIKEEVSRGASLTLELLCLKKRHGQPKDHTLKWTPDSNLILYMGPLSWPTKAPKTRKKK